LVAGTVLSITYISLYKLVRTFLKKFGAERFQANQYRFKFVLEVFGAIKNVKASNLEDKYTQNFSRYSKIYAKNSLSNVFSSPIL